jgi:hypothetical protein
MSKTKMAATGQGYLGEIMIHRLTRGIGVAENVTEGNSGWPPQINSKLKDGSVKNGMLSVFRKPGGTGRENFSTEQN